MFPFASAAALCIVVCHGGPAGHLATFVETSAEVIGPVEVYATGPALKQFQEHGIEVKSAFSIEDEDLVAEEIADACMGARMVITDVGHPLDQKIQAALKRKDPDIVRLAYYDNPENYVPGGYSTVAAGVIQEAQGVLFANANLAKAPVFKEPGQEIEFGNRTKIGIGYYPTAHAEKLAVRREKERALLRKEFFQRQAVKDREQTVLVYFGGNNEEYFHKALPAFLSLLQNATLQSDLSDFAIVLQQHPGAKAKNIDRTLFEVWENAYGQRANAPTILYSDRPSDEAQVFGDAALYYQTSMGPQFVLVGLPPIQVGHETYEDLLVKCRLCPSVTTAAEWIEALENLKQPGDAIPWDSMLEGLGVRPDWKDAWIHCVQNRLP